MAPRFVRAPPAVVSPPYPSLNTPATLIFLHDYNSSAQRFNRNPPNKQSLAHHIHASPALQHLKVIIPNGLTCIHSSVKGKVWYNLNVAIPNPGDPKRAYDEIEYGSLERNEDDMKVTMDYVESLIREEIASGTAAERIILMGYSQGATIAALFLLTRSLGSELGAVISVAGFAPTPMTSVPRMQKENGLEGRWSKETRLFLLHGAKDAHIPVEIYYAWRTRLEGFMEQGQGIARIEGIVIEEMDHWPIDQVWPDTRKILQAVVPVASQLTESKLTWMAKYTL
ncbi:hypothetical protein VTL71DRAFT_15063 [Oculimacula yallundae]|uniref:Acyl-protein thioesterase 1 n=1 Tax=Oculimacula yallundae TaxID=86028 RepID=A0ABR4CG34_9HELO